MDRAERLDHHKFKELAALAQRGALSASERFDLELHLQVCPSCRQAYDEYSLISTQGMDFLAAVYDEGSSHETWDNRPAREKLLARVRGAGRSQPNPKTEVVPINGTLPGWSNLIAPWGKIALAACVLVALSAGAYHLVSHLDIAKHWRAPSATENLQASALNQKQSDDLLASDRAQIDRLQVQASKAQLDVTRLKDALHAAEARSAVLAAGNHDRDAEIHQVTAERDRLASQLHDAEQSNLLLQTELTDLRNERDRVVLRSTSLQSKIDDLTAATHEQDRRLQDDEQYLASDRDIRELMGARKLYIADVFDVDSGSRTRKPFGRVFYTQSKSLIFYAFDLDRQPGVKTASAFQVWGQRDAETGEKNRATNLGILYMDSESNRRWVLRLDDPKQLAEIDAVFVTVEPHGGSQKPTGKPFLYALLRKEANHP